MPDVLLTPFYLLLMILGFCLVIFIHELGHFLAARWAGIRAPAFALGIGSPIVSYRPGLGFRRGTTIPEYREKLIAAGEDPEAGDLPGVGQTEYRLCWLPLGGYVTMLGQEDADPSARSSKAGSYQNAPVWKRMVVISAGVVMNVLLAAVLFIAVFLAGMTEPAPLVGDVRDGGPADRAGIMPGDRIVAIDGRATGTFRDVFVAAAMAPANHALSITVDRPGAGELTLEADPEPVNDGSGIQTLGISVASSGTVWDEPKRSAEAARLRAELEAMGLVGVEPGAELVAINGEPIELRDLPPGRAASGVGGRGGGAYRVSEPLNDAIARSDGKPIQATFRNPGPGDRTTTVSLQPEPAYQTATVDAVAIGGDGPATRPVEHLLGLAPPMRVLDWPSAEPRQGLQPGDVFVRIADVPWPTVAEGVNAIRRRAGGAITLEVLREGERITLDANVGADGTVGFFPESAFDLGVVGGTITPSARANDDDSAGGDGQAEGDDADVDAALPPPASALDRAILPGSRLVRVREASGDSAPDANADPNVESIPVGTFADLRAALRELTRDDLAADRGTSVDLTLALPTAGGPEETVTLDLAPEHVRQLHELQWRLPRLATAFEPVETLVKAAGPVEAVAMGLHRTKRVLITTYLTFQRLAEGTVSPTQLQGPVGITHTGTRFAEQGPVYLLFFLALISANLAVINFLPIPIVDGGQFLMLAYEGVTRRPVPVAVQNLLTLAGLLLIASVFLFVTYNDIVRLLSGF